MSRFSPDACSSIADRVTPAVQWVLLRAAKIATFHEDKHIRLAHLQEALKSAAEMHDEQRQADSNELAHAELCDAEERAALGLANVKNQAP